MTEKVGIKRKEKTAVEKRLLRDSRQAEFGAKDTICEIWQGGS